MHALIALAAALAPLSTDDVNPTKYQKEHLAIYVDAWTDRLATHFESLDKTTIERAVRKATYNGVSARAEIKFEDTLVEFVMEDLGLKEKASREIVRFDLAPQLRKRAVVDSGEALDRFGFKHHHRQVLLHNRGVLDELTQMQDNWRLGEDQEKALRVMAEVYTARMIDILDRPKEKKLLIKLLTQALCTIEYERAEVSARNKARGAMRRKLTARDKPKTDEQRLALSDEIDELMPRAFPGTFWSDLAFDHERCLKDAENHRKVLKNVLKGKKRPPESSPPRPEVPEEG